MKNPLLALAVFIPLLPLSLSAQNYPYFTWVKHEISVGADWFNDVATDQAGNVYAIGYFDEDIIVGSDTFLIPASGNSDIMFVKYDANGNYIWGQQFGGVGPDDAARIIITDQDEIFICGRIIGNAYMGSIAGVPQYLTSSGAQRGFLSKFDTSGELIWTSKMDGTFQTTPVSFALDSNHDIYITGYFYSTMDFGNSVTLTSSDQLDFFVAKYSNAGICQWAFAEGGKNADWVYDIAIDQNDNFAIAGSFDDTMNLSGTILAAHGNGDAYVTLYNSSGVLQWYDQAGSWSTFTVTSDAANRLTFDQNNNLLVTGYYMDTIIFANDTLLSSGYQDIFMVQYSNTGTVLQTKTFGGSTLHDQPSAIGIDNNNNILLTGNGNYSISIDDSTISSYGINDWMIVNFSPTWQVNWTKHAGTTYNDGAARFTVNSGGDIYVAGDIGDHLTAQFDTIFVTATGTDQWYDACLAKLTFGTSEPNSVASVMNDKDVVLFPNPANDYFIIQGLAANTLIGIYDLQGRCVRKEKVQNNELISVSNLSPGLYFIYIPTYRKNIKLVVE